MSKNTKKILFIDDEIICHDVINLIMPGITHYGLISAFTIEEALALAKHHSDELKMMITDVILPDGNGFDLYQDIKIINNLHHLPCIFQSGYSNHDLQFMNNLQDSHCNIIYKPYTQNELAEMFHQCDDSADSR